MLDIEPIPSDPAMLAKIRRSLDRIPAKQRNIFLLGRIEGKSYAEVAKRYGVSERRIRRSIARTMHILILEIFEDKPQPFWRRYWPL